ncbi:hypothetical protein JK361_25100 [Streptomyces sp. 5-8]|uniref:Secreted protein n=2 Tax=Streptomyces TaxID=1883 RepID=A0ABS1P629_9ACTN|nr:hypothetical protein [Streptomyces musisoli]MBY8843089.1 hypothetical protein [Streptomyces sp. SP2-10]
MVRTTTWTRGRRGAVTAASAAVVCLGGMLAACGGDGSGGYTAVGAGRGGPTAAAPTGQVRLVPLDGAATGGTPGDATRATGSPTAPADAAAPAEATSPAGTTGPPASRGPGHYSGAPEPDTRDTPSPHPKDPAPGSPEPGGGKDGRTTPPPASPGPAPGRTTPATPAALSWDDPATEDTGRRWCQKVTVGFRNSGGTAVRSGDVTFGTHIIGGLGIDWGTVESTVELPVPLAPGARRSPTWTVCVDAWRVPLGMHIETRDVSVAWD